MKTIEISGTFRTDTKKATTKKLRREGNIPCVMYGLGNSSHFSLQTLDINRILQSSDTFIYKIDLDGSRKQAILKESQFHPVTDEVIHMDFLEIGEGVPVEVAIPISLIGSASGLQDGGRLVTLLRKMRVKGLPADLPETIEVDISSLELGRTIKVSDIDFGDVQVITPTTQGIAAIEIPRAAKTVVEEGEEEAEEGGEEATAE